MIKFRCSGGVFWITIFGYGIGVTDVKKVKQYFPKLLFGRYLITKIKPINYK